VRRPFAAAAAALLLAAPTLAQQPPASAPPPGPPPAAPAPAAGQARPAGAGTPEQAEGLRNDPAVRQSQDPPPTAQGTRAPTATDTPTATGELQALLAKVWREPVDLQGNPVARAGGGRAAPSPAAGTAQGCGASGAELAARPAASPAPC
jgi:hypothetical protein